MVSCLQLADDSHDDNVEDDDFRATFDMDFFLRSTLLLLGEFSRIDLESGESSMRRRR